MSFLKSTPALPDSCSVWPDAAVGEHHCGRLGRRTCNHSRPDQLGVDIQIKGHAEPESHTGLVEAPALFGWHEGHFWGNGGQQIPEGQAVQPFGAFWDLSGGQKYRGAESESQSVCAWTTLENCAVPWGSSLLISHLSEPERGGFRNVGRRSSRGPSYPFILFPRDPRGLLPKVIEHSLRAHGTESIPYWN